MPEEHEFFGEAPEPNQFDPLSFHETTQEDADRLYREAEAAPEPEQEAPQEQAEQPYNPILDSMRSKNYDVSNYSSDAELLNDLEGGHQIAAERQKMIDQQLQQLQQLQDAQNLQRQEYLNQQAEKKEPESDRRAIPEFDQNWINLVEQDESGRFVVKPEYIGSVDPGLAEKVNTYINWRQERSNSLLENPVQTLMDEGLEDYIQSRIDSALQSNIDVYDTKKQAEDFVAQNANVLYIIDPQTGAPAISPDTGQPVLSPAGQALSDAHVMLREQGVLDPATRHGIAMKMIQPQVDTYISGMQQQTQQPQQQNSLPSDYPEVPQVSENDYHKKQYQEQPFAAPTNPGYMPNAQVQPQANSVGKNGLPEHQSLGSLATQLAVHKGFLQPNG